MEQRIVQVGSQFMLAGFAGGLYHVRTAHSGDHQAVNRNPRALLGAVATGDLFSSPAAAAAAYREAHQCEPIWDVYEDPPLSGEFVSLSDASREFGLDAATLRNQIHNRSLTGYKFGRNWVITRDEMERYRRENLGAVGRRSNESDPPGSLT